jgi:hypothetical protein
MARQRVYRGALGAGQAGLDAASKAACRRRPGRPESHIGERNSTTACSSNARSKARRVSSRPKRPTSGPATTPVQLGALPARLGFVHGDVQWPLAGMRLGE